MKTKEDIRPVTYLKSRAADLLTQINTTHRPVVITQNGEARAVLQDPESYEQMRRTIGLLKLVAQGEDDIRAGHTVAHEAVFAHLRRTLSHHRS
jgi:prevent-host-death family protein